MAAVAPLNPPPPGAGGAITLQAAQRAVGNALRTVPDPNPFQDNGATRRLKNALDTYITNFEAAQLNADPTVIHKLQCEIAIWGLHHWPITVSNDETRDLVKQYRFNYRQTGRPTTHPTARVARLIADRLLLIEAFEKTKAMLTLEIVDYYGSKRFLSLKDKIYSMWAPFSIRLISLEWYRPLITTKDRTDYTHLLTQYPSYIPSVNTKWVGIMTDIYCPPKDIVNEIDKAGCVLALFATQIFPKSSIAGCHFDHMTYINRKGVIHQAPGSQDHEWPNTFVNEEWVTHRGFHINNTVPMTWEWDSWTTVSDYRLYRLLPTQGFQDLDGPFDAPTSQSSFIEERHITPKRWRSLAQAYYAQWFCRPTIFYTPLKVFLPAVEALGTKYVNKTRQTFQESNCQTEVGNILDKKEYRTFWQGLRENSGITKEKVALDTATYIFWGGLEEDFRMRRRTTESLGDVWRSFKDLKNNLPKLDWTIPWPIVIIGATALVAWFYYHRNSRLENMVRNAIAPPPKALAAIKQHVTALQPKATQMKELETVFRPAPPAPPPKLEEPPRIVPGVSAKVIRPTASVPLPKNTGVLEREMNTKPIFRLDEVPRPIVRDQPVAKLLGDPTPRVSGNVFSNFKWPSFGLREAYGTLKQNASSLITKYTTLYEENRATLPNADNVQHIVPSPDIGNDIKTGFIENFWKLTSPETRFEVIGPFLGGLILVGAPVYEEAFKLYVPYGTTIIGVKEGLGIPIWTLFKVCWHKFVTSRPNRVAAHHSWNAGCSVAQIMIYGENAGALAVVAKYGWPLHFYAIFSKYAFENALWFINGFAMNWVINQYAIKAAIEAAQAAELAAATQTVGFLGPLSAILLLTGAAVYWFLKRSPSNRSLVMQFREDYADVQSHLNTYPQTMALTYREAVLPAITATQSYEDSPIDPDVTDEMEEIPSVYVLLGTTSMMYRPYGFNQFYHAYKQRNVVPCLITPTCEQLDDECELHSLKRTTCPIGVEWRHAAAWAGAVIRSTIGNLDMQVVPLKSQDWIRHFNGAAKKQRAHDGIMQRNTGYIRKETNIFLKGDEVLYGREGFMKPRTVKALHPTVQASCYKEVGECMDRLKIFFNQDQIHYIRSWSITFSIGSGKTSSELNTWFATSKEWVSIDNRRAAIIVAGDDFFGIIRDNDTIFYLENDFAKFDRTQGVHAQDAEASILNILGMSEKTLYLLFTTMNLQPRYENKRLAHQQIFHMPAQRATGAPDTTIGNTINNIISVIYSVMLSNSFTNLATDQARLGLEAKLQRHEDPSEATFLKGWWLPCGHDYYWLPLPSQTVKMGKILTLPTQIFKHLPEDSAWRSAAKSMGCSYKNVPYEYPLFGPLLQRYAALEGEVIDLAPYQPNDGHKIVVDEKAQIDKYVARVYIANRYGITYEDIVTMEAEILSMPFPGLAAHQGWAQVVKKDYG